MLSGLFKRAVEDWGQLTEQQRNTFTEEYKAEIENAGSSPPAQAVTNAPPTEEALPTQPTSPAAAAADGGEEKVRPHLLCPYSLLKAH